ncbi:MAG: alpha/beta fold hydrolase [Woeseiaceae bacterium]|nr:alpha/beta fold hydrolase [Woeseiaceae bacterium]
MTTVVFSHGQESGPWGTKIKAMAAVARELGCEAVSVDYRGIAEPAARVDKLVAECDALDDRLVLVGSSMGGHVATAAAEATGAIGVFVLAPAYFMPGYEDLTPEPPALPITIVHGWHDDVVPVENSIRFAAGCAATLHIVDGDHRLTAAIDEINDYLRLFLGRVAGARAARAGGEQ